MVILKVNKQQTQKQIRVNSSGLVSGGRTKEEGKQETQNCRLKRHSFIKLLPNEGEAAKPAMI
jgi:hypothetical protein